MTTPVKEIVIVGDGMCGKTSTVGVYLGNRFTTDYIPTVYENYTSKVKYEGRNISLRLLDTAVQEDFEIFRPMLYRKASVFVVMYSVDRPESLANVYEKWVPELRQYCPDVPIILVANKTDLRYTSSVVGQLSENDERPVSSSEGRAIARKIKAVAFRECSALTGHGVNEVFKAALLAKPQKKRTPSWKWFTNTITTKEK
ncbi:Ras-like GTP-binding Rho1 [Paramuricea clavata]|nr:Ras-like GTP-binding Rho1 [Paramuricea clavata]